MNAKQYCSETGMTTGEFLAKAKTVAGKYSKIVHSMCSNPEYGVCPSPAVRALFPNAKPNRQKENRRKPNQFTFRLTDEMCAAFSTARNVNNSDMQTAAEAAVVLYIEKAALEAGTSKTADVNNTTESITESERDVNV